MFSVFGLAVAERSAWIVSAEVVAMEGVDCIRGTLLKREHSESASDVSLRWLALARIKCTSFALSTVAHPRSSGAANVESAGSGCFAGAR